MSYLPEYLRELTLPPFFSFNFNTIHPLVVHFPIALLFTAPVFVLLGLFIARARRSLLASGLILMGLGTLWAWLAVESGEAASKLVGGNSAVNEVLEQHEEMARGSLTVFTALTALLALIMLGLWIARKLRPENPAPTTAVTPETPPTPAKCRCCRCGGTAWVLAIYLVLYAGGLFLLANAAHRGGILVHQYGVRAPFSDPKLTFTTSAPTSAPSEH